jgi:cell wall-associated NlpC family hydrolase
MLASMIALKLEIFAGMRAISALSTIGRGQMKRPLYFLLLALCVTLTGCQTTPSNPSLSSDITVLRPDAAAVLMNERQTRAMLYAQYDEWRAVRYRIGGLSKNGVDCSGFVYLTFRDRFGIALPRSTDEQATLGRKIEERELRSGDLVFFRTGRNIRHVGIFLEDRKFLHASTLKGVMISSLDDVYWAKEYWRAASFKS